MAVRQTAGPFRTTRSLQPVLARRTTTTGAEREPGLRRDPIPSVTQQLLRRLDRLESRDAINQLATQYARLIDRQRRARRRQALRA